MGSGFRILGLQFDMAWEDKRTNHARVRAMVEAIGPKGGEVVVLPEMFSTGFSMNVLAISDTWSGEDAAFIANLARQFGVWVIAGTVTTGAEGKGRNQAMIVSPDGSRAGQYTKLQPFAPGKEALHYLAGQEAVVVDIAGVKVAPLICYDLRFPEPFRAGLRRGAECFVVIASWPEARAEHWTALLRARAIENQAYVVGINRAGRDPWLGYRGESAAFDPRGRLIRQLGGEEGWLEVLVDAEEVRRWRAEFNSIGDIRTDLG